MKIIKIGQIITPKMFISLFTHKTRKAIFILHLFADFFQRLFFALSSSCQGKIKEGWIFFDLITHNFLRAISLNVEELRCRAVLNSER